MILGLGSGEVEVARLYVRAQKEYMATSAHTSLGQQDSGEVSTASLIYAIEMDGTLSGGGGVWADIWLVCRSRARALVILPDLLRMKPKVNPMHPMQRQDEEHTAILFPHSIGLRSTCVFA